MSVCALCPISAHWAAAMCKKERDWGKPKKGMCASGEVGVDVLYKAMNL